MDYSKMTDFEINKRVADIAMNGTWHVRQSHPDNTTGGWLYGSNGIQTYDLPDYCNNVADAWPIMAEHEINVLWNWNEEGLHGATARPLHEYEHENALRAAMIVYLQLQGAK